MNKNIRYIRFGSFILFIVIMIAFLVRLGFWQLSRAEEKKLRLAQLSNNTQAPLHSLAKVSADDFGTKIVITGIFDSKKAVLLDNQIHEGRVGYRLFVPFSTQDHSLPILVDLGWIGAPKDRNTLPELAPLQGAFTVSGVLDSPSQRFVLDNTFTPSSFPLRVQRIELNAIARLSDSELMPFVLRAQTIDPVSSPIKTRYLPWQFTPTWTPVIMMPAKHYGYAVQWFLIAIAVFVGAMIWCKREIS